MMSGLVRWDRELWTLMGARPNTQDMI